MNLSFSTSFLGSLASTVAVRAKLASASIASKAWPILEPLSSAPYKCPSFAALLLTLSLNARTKSDQLVL